jgi:hypothetical protein
MFAYVFKKLESTISRVEGDLYSKNYGIIYNMQSTKILK